MDGSYGGGNTEEIMSQGRMMRMMRMMRNEEEGN